MSKARYLIEYAELMKEWDWDKNQDLTPAKLTCGSRKIVWWTCSKNHSWKLSIHRKVNENYKCPFCSNRKACKDNCLATTHPKLSLEWHYDRNILTPKDVTARNDKKIWWVCYKNHSWEASVRNRAKLGVGCPYCSNKKVCKDNCLITTHPKLLKEWDHNKNKKITPDSVTAGGHKKVWWVCSKNHSWEAPIVRRSKGIGCPYCSNQKVCEDNCLTTTHPKLLEEWSYEKNTLTPNDIVSGSQKKVWWECKNNHSWKAVVCDRASGKGCPYCSNNRVCLDNCLATKFPMLAAEWDYKKNLIGPENILPGSHKKAWWRCKNGHFWEAQIKSRALGRAKCPQCSNNISKISQKWLDLLNIPKKSREKRIKTSTNTYIIVDALYKNTVYEFHGCFWHGCPKCFNPNNINPIAKVSFKTLYTKTMQRESEIKKLGYSLIVIWENDFVKNS